MLTKLVPDIKKTAQLVEEIGAACREQDTGANQVSQAIQQLDQVIQQNAAAAGDLSSTSEKLSAQAEKLQDSIAFFQIGNGNGQGRPNGARAARGAPAAAKFRGERALPGGKPAKSARHATPAGAKHALHKERNPGARPVSDGIALDLGGNDNNGSEWERF